MSQPLDLWPDINRIRGLLIDRRIAKTITLAEDTLLAALQDYADAVIPARKYPEVLSAYRRRARSKAQR